MFGRVKKQPFIKMAQLSTLIADGVEITGDLLFTSGMRIDGRVKGDVTGRPAEGRSPSLLVTGSIRYRQLQMDVGATVQGHLLRVAATSATGNVVELGADKAAAGERR